MGSDIDGAGLGCSQLLAHTLVRAVTIGGSEEQRKKIVSRIHGLDRVEGGAVRHKHCMSSSGGAVRGDEQERRRAQHRKPIETRKMLARDGIVL